MKHLLKLLLCFSFVLFLTTCSKVMCGCDPVPSPVFFKATILDTSESLCKRPLLRFEDSVSISAGTGLGKATYIADQLPDSLKIPGKKIRVTVSLLQPNEDFSCTGSGDSYPHLKINYATSAN